MRFWPLLLLLSLFVVSECAKEKSSDRGSWGFLSKITNWCQKTWTNVKNFFSGRVPWRITMFGKTFKISMPTLPKSWSSVRRRSSKFGNTIKGDAASRAFLAIYVNVAFAFTVYIYLTVRQFGIAMRLRKSESSDIYYPIKPSLLGTSLMPPGFGDIVKMAYVPQPVEMQMEEGTRPPRFSESDDDVFVEDVVYDNPATYRTPECKSNVLAEQLLTSELLREVPSPHQTYMRYQGYEPVINVNELLTESSYTPIIKK